MSTYLYTLRKSTPKNIKTQNGKLPIFHYEFSNGNVSMGWSGGLDEYTTQNIHRATTRFYQREEVEIRDEWRWEWRTEIQYNEPKEEYRNGILITQFRPQKKYPSTLTQPIYYQSTPVVQWIDWNEGDKWKGVEVGRMVNGKAHFTKEGADLLFEKMNVIIAPERVFPPNIQSA